VEEHDFQSLRKNKLLVIPTRSGGIPFVPKLSASAFVRGTGFIDATMMFGLPWKSTAFSLPRRAVGHALRVANKMGLAPVFRFDRPCSLQLAT